MPMLSVFRSFRSKMKWRINQRNVWRFTAGVGTLLLLSFIYVNFNMSSSVMTEAIRSNKRTASCAEFDPATVTEKLDSSKHLHDIMYTNGEISEFVCSIMTHNMNLTAKLDCSVAIDSRYDYLRPSTSVPHRIRYYFALDLHQAVHVIIPLMGSIIEANAIWGPNSALY